MRTLLWTPFCLSFGHEILQHIIDTYPYLPIFITIDHRLVSLVASACPTRWTSCSLSLFLSFYLSLFFHKHQYLSIITGWFLWWHLLALLWTPCWTPAWGSSHAWPGYYQYHHVILLLSYHYLTVILGSCPCLTRLFYMIMINIIMMSLCYLMLPYVILCYLMLSYIILCLTRSFMSWIMIIINIIMMFWCCLMSVMLSSSLSYVSVRTILPPGKSLQRRKRENRKNKKLENLAAGY